MTYAIIPWQIRAETEGHSPDPMAPELVHGVQVRGWRTGYSSWGAEGTTSAQTTPLPTLLGPTEGAAWQPLPSLLLEHWPWQGPCMPSRISANRNTLCSPVCPCSLKFQWGWGWQTLSDLQYTSQGVSLASSVAQGRLAGCCCAGWATRVRVSDIWLPERSGLCFRGEQLLHSNPMKCPVSPCPRAQSGGWLCDRNSMDGCGMHLLCLHKTLLSLSCICVPGFLCSLSSMLPFVNRTAKF